VSIPRRVVVLLALLVACAPGPAYAQTTTLPQDGTGVSTTPPVPLDGGSESPPAPNPPPPHTPPPANVAPSPPAAPGGSDLPNTGSDPRLMFLVGATLTLLGVGLRLRTADADHY
jgi:LPXTG-motif cell wall-anchored protein